MPHRPHTFLPFVAVLVAGKMAKRAVTSDKILQQQPVQQQFKNKVYLLVPLLMCLREWICQKLAFAWFFIEVTIDFFRVKLDHYEINQKKDWGRHHNNVPIITHLGLDAQVTMGCNDFGPSNQVVNGSWKWIMAVAVPSWPSCKQIWHHIAGKHIGRPNYSVCLSVCPTQNSSCFLCKPEIFEPRERG